MVVGERGRNRTYNLLIKSQLLCQLSYAPTVSGKAGTNFDYSIRLTLASARSALFSSTLSQLSSPAWVTVSYQERSHAMEAVRLTGAARRNCALDVARPDFRYSAARAYQEFSAGKSHSDGHTSLAYTGNFH